MVTKTRLLHDTIIIPSGSVATTQSATDNTTKVATTAYVTTALANLADSAPSTLNTLNELAAALGDDANFSTTVTNSIAAKLPLAGGTISGTVIFNSAPTFNTAITMGSTLNVASTIGIAGTTVIDGSRNLTNIGTITTAGDVGIGTTASIGRLEVKGAKTQSGGAPIGNVLIADSTALAANVGGGITFQGVYHSGGNLTGLSSIEAMKENATHNEYGGALVLKTRENQGAMNERMRIDSSGNVGIGTTSPDENLTISSTAPTIKLIDSDVTQQNTIIKQSGGNFFVLARDNTNNAGIVFAGNGGGSFSEYARFDSAGKFGIGTTLPEAKLDVRKTLFVGDGLSYNASSESAIEMGATNGTAVDNNQAYKFKFNIGGTAAAGQNLEIGRYRRGVGLGEIIRVMGTTGNVGIGVTNPAYKLVVSSKLVVGDNPGVGLSGMGNTIHVREGSTSGIHFPLVIGGGTHVAGAAFGIGLDPEGYGNRNKIAILAEGIGAGYSRGRLHFAIDSVSDSGQVTLADSKMCILENGNIGIGDQVDNPSGKLDIRGGRAGIISTDSSWGQFRVANSGVGEVGITVMNGCTASEYLSDGAPTSTNKFIMGINPYAAGTDTWGIGHGNLGDSIMHIDGAGQFGFGPHSENPHGYFEILKQKSGTDAPNDYELLFTLNSKGYFGNGYKAGLIRFCAGDTASGQDNFYAGIGCKTLTGTNNSEEGSLDFHVKNTAQAETLAVQIIGKAGTGIAGSGQHAKAMLFRYQGIAIDRVWAGYPGISVLNSSDYSTSSSAQAEFRFHGTNSSSAAYPGTSGADFSVDVRTDGAYVTGSDRRRKTNITTISSALSKVKQLTGKRFQTTNRQSEINQNRSMANNYEFGFIAQEVESIIPESLKYHADEDDGTEDWNSAYSMNYASVVPLLVNAIKEQDTVIQDLKTRIETLEG